MFRFDFDEGNSAKENAADLEIQNDLYNGLGNCTGLPNPERSFEKSHLKFSYLDYRSVSVKFSTKMSMRIRDLNEIQPSNGNLDIIPTVYEGGFKVWECTIDLINHIAKMPDFHRDTILDLGCGSGLVGIKCLLKHALVVDFHDFNENVLKQFTIPNVLMNSGKLMECGEFHIDSMENCNFDFFYNDWSLFDNNGRMYDFIFSSETVYSPNSYEKIASLMVKFLKGTFVLASKKYYYGCEGSASDFCSYVQLHFPESFSFELVETISANVPREIWYIQRILN